MFIGRRIKQLRERKGLSQGDIEAVSGMLRAYISRVEHGHTVPSLETLERFAAALDVPLYQLFYEEEDAPPGANVASGKTTDAMAKPLAPNCSEARMLTMLKGLAQRMVESDRQLLLKFASQLAGRLDKVSGGVEGSRDCRPRSGEMGTKWDHSPRRVPRSRLSGPRNRAACFNQVIP